MFKEANPTLASLLDAATSGTLLSAPPFEMGKPLRKSLASTGHLVERFLAACDTLRLKVQQEHLPELLPYFHGFDLSASTLLKGEGHVVCPLHLKGSILKLQPLLVTDRQVLQTVSAWQRVQLDAPKTLPRPLEVPANANAPLWPALLHLRALHSFWEQQLRHSHVETLLDRVPSAWMLDPAPIPPGAVIPKLEIGSWSELTPNRSFIIQDIAAVRDPILLEPTVSPQQWHSSINQALQSFGHQPQALSETATGTEAILLGIYQRQNQRVDLMGGIALHPDETGTWRLTRW